MKQLFFMFACVVMSVLAMGQVNQLVWANGRLLYGTPIESIDSLTYDDMEDVDTLHLLLPRTLIKVVHDTVYIHDTVYVETDCGGEGDTPSAGIGVFSVSADKQVTFSKGNLQYHPANNEWRFAESQTDYIGAANSNCSSTYNGWLDLFGWGTGANPIDNLAEDRGVFVDWGINKIGNNAPNTWRTLSEDEWWYVFEGRTNAQLLYGFGCVNGVNGLIVLPDNWTTPKDIIFVASTTRGLENGYNPNSDNFTHNKYTMNDWIKMEVNGAVFLPAAGVDYYSKVSYVQEFGRYWSSTWYEGGSASILGFDSSNIYVSADDLYKFSVRLVKDIEGGGTTPDTPTNTENGYEYVDLGLPSGLKWATCNVGANAPEEYGDYFAWGETTTKSTYDWSTYKWCNGSYDTQTKYCTVDNKTVLDKEDDAAAVNWGGKWRMPTKAEKDELRQQCTWTWTSKGGVNGYQVTGPNGKSIFLPAAGYRYGSSLDLVGSYGYYWSSSLDADGLYPAYYLNFSSGSVLWYLSSNRYYGQSVRPVCQ